MIKSGTCLCLRHWVNSNRQHESHLSFIQAHREGSFGGLSLSDWLPETAVITGSDQSNESTDVAEHKGSFFSLCLCLSRCLSLRLLAHFLSSLSLSSTYFHERLCRESSAKHLEHIFLAFMFSRLAGGYVFIILSLTCAERINHHSFGPSYYTDLDSFYLQTKIIKSNVIFLITEKYSVHCYKCVNKRKVVVIEVQGVSDYSQIVPTYTILDPDPDTVKS